jgi:hypothetical protein
MRRRTVERTRRFGTATALSVEVQALRRGALTVAPDLLGLDSAAYTAGAYEP